jgi:Spy/CpxP family protein refolding chaperone
MKKVIFAALLAASLSGFAQEAGKKGGADKMLQKMTTELSLTADQQATIKPIVEEQVALKKDSKENPDHADANKVKVKELNKKIKEVLTPAQLEIQKANMEKAKAEGNSDKKEGKE